MKRSAYYAKVEKRNFKLRFIWQVGKMQIFQRLRGRNAERNSKKIVLITYYKKTKMSAGQAIGAIRHTILS